MSGLEIIILAAGQGTRMKSSQPKVLHTLGAKPLLSHVIAAGQALKPDAIHVVYGYGGETVKDVLHSAEVNWVCQSQQLGTGHAVMQAISDVNTDNTVLILYGDVPLILSSTLQRLVSICDTERMAVLTAVLDEPFGYGRIMRNRKNQVIGIVEQKDANPEQQSIKEINTGMMAVSAKKLNDYLNQLTNNNAQGEYYLTDIIALAVSQGVEVQTTSPQHTFEIEGVNTQNQLAALERIYQQRQAQCLMEAGVCIKDPARFDLRGELVAGRDVTIDVNVVIEGRVNIGDGSYIGPNNYIRDSKIGARSIVYANCVLEESEIGNDNHIGPFARLRPLTQLHDQVKVGNFVEVKKSNIEYGSKINHLSYVGDTLMGKHVNVGAGTITCNYDGANKHQTIIGDDVFIGSDTQLVAPVEIGSGATIGAGSTITHDAPSNELTLSRAQQKTRSGWKRPVKKR